MVTKLSKFRRASYEKLVERFKFGNILRKVYRPGFAENKNFETNLLAYAEHGLERYLQNQAPHIKPHVSSHFSIVCPYRLLGKTNSLRILRTDYNLYRLNCLSYCPSSYC